jgi:hypothetical protein
MPYATSLKSKCLRKAFPVENMERAVRWLPFLLHEKELLRPIGLDKGNRETQESDAASTTCGTAHCSGSVLHLAAGAAQPSGPQQLPAIENYCNKNRFA